MSRRMSARRHHAHRDGGQKQQGLIRCLRGGVDGSGRGEHFIVEGVCLVAVSGFIPRTIPWTEWSSILPPSAFIVPNSGVA